MENLTRVKKYEKLREEIETKSPNEIQNQTIQNIKKEETYVPIHEKTFLHDDVKEIDSADTFRNEYLDSFIQEVRDYNMKKGTRECEDTKLDILQQLNSKNREKRSQYIEKMDVDLNPMEEEQSLKSIHNTNEISKQVMSLIHDSEEIESYHENENIPNEVEENVEEVIAHENTMESSKIMTLEERIASLESQIKEEPSKSDIEFISDEEKRELLEQTMQLKVQMDEYKEELNELNTGIDSNNRLLNMIITILIIALLAVIGVVIYWLVSGGII